MGEHYAGSVGVVGSNPIGSTKLVVSNLTQIEQFCKIT